MIENKFFKLPILLILLVGCNVATELIPLEVDQKLGENISAQIHEAPAEFDILDPSTHPQIYNYVQGIRDQILQSDDVKYKDEFPYNVTIIDNDSVLNAFAVPGGHIFVYTGLIKFLDSESELAGVMAHEIAHAELRHSVEQMGARLGTGLLISLVFGGDYGQILDMGAQMLFLKFSRGDEAEADEYAVRYLYDTKYDPRGVAGFFQKLIKEEKDAAVPAFLSTHPASEDRIDRIMETWKELGAQEGTTGVEQHRSVVNTL